MTGPHIGEFYRISTDSVRAQERFNFWRTHHHQLDLRLTDPTAENQFEGEILECLGPEGALFGHSKSTGVVSHFGRAPANHILLSHVQSGIVEVRHNRDGGFYGETPNGLTMMDTRHNMTSASPGRFSHLYLTLPEPYVAQVLGHGDLGLRAVQRLPETGLFPFVLTQMKLLAANWDQLGPEEASAAIQSMAGLALTGLRQLARGPLDRDDNVATHALYRAACRYIERHAVTHQIAAVEIASILGCSRAHLYRVFAAHGTTIGEVIRKANLDKARWMLSKGRPLARIAWETGYADTASFGRAFKRHFGLTPGEYRAQNGQALKG